jgi:hypothetical protein
MSLTRFKHIYALAALVAGVSLSLPARAGIDSLPDSQVVENAVEQAANNCDNYSGVKAKPDIVKIPIFALRMAAQRNVIICPNITMSEKGPAVIWYGNHKAMVWNPNIDGAASVMDDQLVTMGKNDTYPSSIITWDAKGQEMKNQTVPMFELSPTSTLVH